MADQRHAARWFCAVLVSLSAQSCSVPNSDPSEVRGTFVVVSATLIDGNGDPPQSRMSILVRDGQIVSVAPDSVMEVPPGARVIDAEGKFVIPGLSDTHFHFGLGAPLPTEPGDKEESLARELYYGVTTILQIGATSGSTDSIRVLRDRRADGSLQAPFIYGTGGHLTLQGTHPIYTIFPREVREAANQLADVTPQDQPVDLYALGIGMSFVRTHEAARTAVRERARGGMDVIKITIESGPTPFGNDHPLMSADMVQTIVDEASLHGLRVLAHVTSREELEVALAGGASGAVHVPQDVPLPDTALADQMSLADFMMTPTLTLFAGPGDLEDPFLRATASAKEIAALANPEFEEIAGRRWTCCAPFDDLLATVGMLHERGVRIAVGTDTGNPYVFPGYSVHVELELLVRAGLTPMEAIEAATRVAAEMVGADSEYGTIEPGKRADLLILAADPLEDIRNTRSLEVVISEGRVIDRQALLRGRQADNASGPAA